ncbi:MAG: hypothetical protein R2824_13295 [Saprospiraceae bacterium]
MKIAGWLCLLFLVFHKTALSHPQLSSVQVKFFSEQLSISYNTDILLDLARYPQEREMVAFFKTLEHTDYTTLLSDLLQKQEQFQLNDWLFYDLMKRSVRSIIGNDHAAKVELTCWFLLSKAGFDTRLTYLNGQQFVYVYTRDELFEVPMITENGRNYANLTGIEQKKKTNEALYMLNFVPNENGKAFGFYLQKLPHLKPDIEKKKFSFRYKDHLYEALLDVDKNAADIMQQYPFIDEKQYLQVPFSDALAGSLLPQLQKWVAGLSKVETLELLVAFTRSSFQYREDKDYFGYSKPMIADEVFHYPYSDCEDRSALFYRLVKATLDLPMIIVAFPDHLTIAVALDEEIGDPIPYHGRNYYICDQTGPVNS